MLALYQFWINPKQEENMYNFNINQDTFSKIEK